MFKEGMLALVGQGFIETIYMTVISTALAYIIGLPLGLVLVVTDKDGIHPIPWLNSLLGMIINFFRSIPFLILLIALMPFTKMVVGTVIGSKAAIVGLWIAAAPFIARMVESSLKEVEIGVVEAAQSMGASPFQIMTKVLLPEAKPSLIVNAAIAVTTILSYSAMAGFCAGGGLGDIALQYGFYQSNGELMWITVFLLFLIVQIFQTAGTWLAKALDKRIKNRKKSKRKEKSI